MPYIKKEDRWPVFKEGPQNGGELQYLIAVHIKNIIGDDYSYSDLEKILGALAGAQMEFYRQVVAPYEDKKIKENGGVYTKVDEDISLEELTEMLELMHDKPGVV